MNTLLLELLEALEAVGQDYEEIYDTECRHQMRGVIHDGFLNPVPHYSLPDDFGLDDPKANEAVRDALNRYITNATVQANELGLDFFGRLAAFQNEDVITASGESDYDDLFGHVPQEEFDSSGKWKG